jgi:hypothetical protein
VGQLAVIIIANLDMQLLQRKLRLIVLELLAAVHVIGPEGLAHLPRSQQHPAKNGIFENLCIKAIILPRQARDKHRETTQKKMCRFSHRYSTNRRTRLERLSITVTSMLKPGTKKAIRKTLPPAVAGAMFP